MWKLIIYVILFIGLVGGNKIYHNGYKSDFWNSRESIAQLYESKCNMTDLTQVRSLYFKIGVKNCKNETVGGTKRDEYFIDLDAPEYKKKWVGYDKWDELDSYVYCYKPVDKEYYHCTGLNHLFLQFQSNYGQLVCNPNIGERKFSDCRLQLKLAATTGASFIWVLLFFVLLLSLIGISHLTRRLCQSTFVIFSHRNDNQFTIQNDEVSNTGTV